MACVTNVGLPDLGVLFHGAITQDGSTLHLVPDALGLTDSVYGYSWTGLDSTLGLITNSFGDAIEDLTLDDNGDIYMIGGYLAADQTIERYTFATDDLDILATLAGANNIAWHPDTSLLYVLAGDGFYSVDPTVGGTGASLVAAGLTDTDVFIHTFAAVPGGIWGYANSQELVFIELDGTVTSHTFTGTEEISTPAPMADGSARYLMRDSGSDPWLGYRINQAMTVTRDACLDVLGEAWVVVYQSPDAGHAGVEADGAEWAFVRGGWRNGKAGSGGSW